MSLGGNFSDFVFVSKSRSTRNNRQGFRRRDFSIRVLSLRALGIGVFLILIAGLLKTQVLEGAYYRDLSDGNRVREVFLPAPRGIVYDRNHKPLVSNIPAYRLVKCDRTRMHCKANLISRDQAIILQASGLPENSDLIVDSTRLYHFKDKTAHLLGYVSEVSPEEIENTPNYYPGDKVGRGGVEESYEDILKGTRGKELVEVDAVGKRLKVLSEISPKPGKNISLSLDLNLQNAAYEAIKPPYANKSRGQGAAVVVTNPRTGAVLAIASNPSFDPNLFTDFSVDLDERSRAINDLFNDLSRPMFDRSISGAYPPGSTFKIITSTAGLENGKIDEEFTVEDTGIITIGPYKFANWKYLADGGTQGVVNVVGALKVSNDIFFYRLGEKIGLEGIVSWMEKFGLAKKTGIDLPNEVVGIVPNKAWRAKFAPEWFLGDTFHLAIGQGKMLVTPIQVNAWTNVIANGGKLCRPYLFGEPFCKDLGISKKTLALVKKGLVEACSTGGTAYPLFDFKVPIACKTGTAEFGDPENRTHGWLTAYAPANDPEISVTVLVEAAGEGSDVAAPIVKKVLEEWFKD